MISANLQPNSKSLMKLDSVAANPNEMELYKTFFRSPTNTPNEEIFTGLPTMEIKIELRHNRKSTHTNSTNMYWPLLTIFKMLFIARGSGIKIIIIKFEKLLLTCLRNLPKYQRKSCRLVA